MTLLAATLLELAVEILTPTRQVHRDLASIERRAAHTEANLSGLGEAGQGIGDGIREGAREGQDALERLNAALRRVRENDQVDLTARAQGLSEGLADLGKGRAGRRAARSTWTWTATGARAA